MNGWKKYYLRFVGVAALNAAAFISYRLLVAKLKKKINPVEAKDFSFDGLTPLVSLNFMKHPDLLDKFTFTKAKTSVDKLVLSPFEYQGVWFSLQKYQQSPKFHYNLYVDVDACKKNNISLRDFVDEVLVGLELTEIPTLWTPEGNTLLEQDSE